MNRFVQAQLDSARTVAREIRRLAHTPKDGTPGPIVPGESEASKVFEGATAISLEINSRIRGLMPGAAKTNDGIKELSDVIGLGRDGSDHGAIRRRIAEYLTPSNGNGNGDGDWKKQLPTLQRLAKAGETVAQAAFKVGKDGEKRAAKVADSYFGGISLMLDAVATHVKNGS